MAVRITITATDRMGRHLVERQVEGETFQRTFEERGRVYEEIIKEHSDHNGVKPFIFTSTTSR